MPLSFGRAPAPQDGALVQRDIVAYLGRLSDHDAHAVVDKHPGANDRARVNFDARQKPGDVRE